MLACLGSRPGQGSLAENADQSPLPEQLVLTAARRIWVIWGEGRPGRVPCPGGLFCPSLGPDPARPGWEAGDG